MRIGAWRPVVLAGLAGAALFVMSSCVFTLPSVLAEGDGQVDSDGQVVDSGGQGDAQVVPDGGNDPNAAVQVTNLHAVWTTPNCIRWEWDAVGVGDQLLEFRLTTGTSEADVLSGTGSARVWTSADNPELGVFALNHTQGVDPVVMTVTDEHLSDTVYYAQLVAIDTSSRRSISNIGLGRTDGDPLHTLVVFSEDQPSGYRLPGTFVRESNDPYQGTFHYEYISVCTNEAACFENLRMQDLGLDSSGISEGEFNTTAYVELALKNQGNQVSWWSSMILWFGGGGFPAEVSKYEGWTVRSSGEYYVLQVPLRAFSFADGPVTHARMALGLDGAGVGGFWEDGATIRVDEISIHW